MEKAITIPVDHPALPGHFPGRPIVPGVVLLDEVAAAAAELIAPELIKNARLNGLSSVKFLSPLLPGEACTVRLTPGREGSLRFECRCPDRTIATGILEFEAMTGR